MAAFTLEGLPEEKAVLETSVWLKKDLGLQKKQAEEKKL